MGVLLPPSVATALGTTQALVRHAVSAAEVGLRPRSAPNVFAIISATEQIVVVTAEMTRA